MRNDYWLCTEPDCDWLGECREDASRHESQTGHITVCDWDRDHPGDWWEVDTDAD